MSPILDTATINGAHACGLDREKHVNSPDRLRLFYEHGAFTLCRNSGHEAVEIVLTDEEFLALADARLEALSREADQARKAIYGRAAA